MPAPAGARDESIDKVVAKIIESVREKGDSEVLALTRKFDGAALTALEVHRDEWDAGISKVAGADRAALGKAAMRVREFHKKRIPASWEMREEGGRRDRDAPGEGPFAPRHAGPRRLRHLPHRWR